MPFAHFGHFFLAFAYPHSTSLNKFRELTSPADLHIYRINERAISLSPADSYIGSLINVRVRYTKIRKTYLV
jgi:hypothetical protein